MDSAKKIEDEAAGAGVAELLSYLEAHLGCELTAYLAGGDNRQELATLTRAPGPVVDRLRCGYEAARILLEVYDAATVRSWFLGANELLADHAPSLVLRRGLQTGDWASVIPAARDFAQSAVPPVSAP